MNNKEDEYLVCGQDAALALDNMSFKNKEDSFSSFNTDIRYIRDKGKECAYCSRPAIWSFTYLGSAMKNVDWHA